MSLQLSKCTIAGNITADLELRTTSNGKNVVSFSVAVNHNDTVSYFEVTAWDKLAEIACKYLAKGSPVLVEGIISIVRTDKGHATKVVAKEIHFLSSKNK